MQKDFTHFHRVTLRKLYSYLRKHHRNSFTETVQIEGRGSLRRIDSLLAFKSDSYLEQLRAALDRLEDGTFGVCLNCKKQIDTLSLDADPTCRICERCELAYSGHVVNYEGSPSAHSSVTA